MWIRPPNSNYLQFVMEEFDKDKKFNDLKNEIKLVKDNVYNFIIYLFSDYVVEYISYESDINPDYKLLLVNTHNIQYVISLLSHNNSNIKLYKETNFIKTDRNIINNLLLSKKFIEFNIKLDYNYKLLNEAYEINKKVIYTKLHNSLDKHTTITYKKY